MSSHFPRLAFQIGTVALFLASLTAATARTEPDRQSSPDWQAEVRADTQSRNWTKALEVVNGVLGNDPRDQDGRAWRGRILLWSGDVDGAEAEFRSLTADSPRDPD